MSTCGSLRSRGAILWRQRSLADVASRLFDSKSRRNFFTEFALHTNGRIGQDGFLTWLKDIFNKCAEDKSRKADTEIVDRAATATFNRPEIAASMRPADSSDKADVINQKLANFCAVQSMTKFEYGNIRAEKRETASSERAYVRQQSAIHATSQSSRFVAGKTSEREMGLDPSCRGPGEMYRSWRNGGAIQLAARNDFNAASHYRCYTSSTNCYRPLVRRVKQPLLGLCVPHGHIDVPKRAKVGTGPGNTKPLIKEPNAAKKREKDETKDRKKEKNPAIGTDGESADSSENRAEMTVNDNPRDDPDAAFRYEWGVKLAEEQAAAEAANDNDEFEKGQQYVTKRLWGVNLKEPKPDIAHQTTANSDRATKRPQNISSIFESGDSVAREAINDARAAQKNATTALDLKDTTAEYLSSPSTDSNKDFIATKEKSDDSYMSSKELREIMRTSPDMLTETITVNDEFNIPEDVNFNTVIAAWQNLTERSVQEVKENYFSSNNMENLEMLSIRPEAPQPKLDVRVVKSTEDSEKTEMSDLDYTLLKSTEIKRVKPLRKSDDYFTGSKKFHTMKTPTRCLHRFANGIVQRRIELPSSNFASVVRIKAKCSEEASAFLSTSSEEPKKVIDETESNERNEQETNLKSHREEKFDNFNSNDILTNDRSFLPVESPTSSVQKQADVDFAKTLDVTANKETEVSANPLQNTGRKKIPRLANSTIAFARKDKSRYKDEDAEDEIKKIYKEPEANYPNLHNADTTYVDFNDPSTDNSSIKSDAIKSAKGSPRSEDGNNVTFDSNVKNDEDGDSNKGYTIDEDYVRLPGDPYPYSRENLDKWRVPPYPRLYETRELSRSSDPSAVARSTLRNANDAYANAAGEPRDSHAGDAVMETSGSDGGAGARKRTGQANGFHVSSRDQRVVSDCLRDDAANTLGRRQWTDGFSQLDADEKINEAARSGDNVPLRELYE